jgi:hypothetical protein
MVARGVNGVEGRPVKEEEDSTNVSEKGGPVPFNTVFFRSGLNLVVVDHFGHG